MQPDSLVFLVIIAIWAAYFAQHWMRRREHLTTARSIEQFSESMRVLERRPSLPTADLSRPAPTSYAVSPVRRPRPQVTVKRAAGPIAPPRLGGPSRAARGLALVSSLALLLVLIPVVALSALTWPLLLLPVTTAAVSFWALRNRVQAEVTAKRIARAAARGEGATAVADSPLRARRVHRTRPAEPAAVANGAVETPAGEDDAVEAAAGLGPAKADEPQAPTTFAQLGTNAPAQARSAQTGRSAAYDIDAVEAAAAPAPVESIEAAPQAPLLDEDDMPLTWDPVPVPRPTYTMKAKAPRQQPAPADVTPTPAPQPRVVRRDERRVAGA
ncbi:MAG: hypothetical protein LWW86_02585 [Micrococcales bacterium]|nr:hypothetical protein [Micrococcales bacterium]